jgi:phosphoserine phosphatase RsbU/P
MTQPNEAVILLAEADAALRDKLTNHLGRYGFAFVPAANAQQLETGILSGDYDVILLGVGLPGLNYRGFFEELENGPHLRYTTILMIRTPETHNEVVSCIGLGANDYIDADDPPQLLHARVQTALGRGFLRGDETLDLRETLELAEDLKRFVLPFGLELSKEMSLEQLVDTILDEAQALCDADGATLYLRTEDNKLEFVALSTKSLQVRLGGQNGDPITNAPIPLLDPTTGEPNRDSVATYVAHSGEMLHIADIYEAKQFDFLHTKVFDTRNKYRTRSVLTLPLKNNKGDVIGVLQLINAMDSSRGMVIPFKENDQLAAEALGIQAAIALNNYFLRKKQVEFAKFETDLEVGRRVQLSFLPKELLQPQGWEVAASFHPARQVAGDFYDIFQVKRNIVGLVMADVCDKGVPAALYMALARSMLRAFSMQHYSLSWAESLFDDDDKGGVGNSEPLDRTLQLNMMPLKEGLKRTNNYLAINHGDLVMFATTFFALLDTRSGLLMYVNAGHNPPMIVGPGGIREKLKPTGPVMGMMPDMPFEVKVAQIEPGETLMTFTDGVPESRAPSGEFFTDARLETALEAQPIDDANALLQRLETMLFTHIDDAAQFDDITMMAVRRLPAAGDDKLSRAKAALDGLL